MKRYFAPEVIQTSGMDCGPASLKSLLEGHGISASYGRLREACQTSLDGSSIDTIEEAAVQLGLDAEQIMIPLDHLLLDSAAALPCLLVVALPNGNTHFVVVWRILGPWVVTMDPATGTNWILKAAFMRQVYRHSHVVPAAAWREWSGNDEFLAPLRERCAALQLDPPTVEAWITTATADDSWQGIAMLDAAVRMCAELVATGAVRKGDEASRAISNVIERARADFAAATDVIPASYWSVTLAGQDEDGEVYIYLHGAVLMRVNGVRDAHAAANTPDIAPELKAALEEPPLNLWGDLWRLVKPATPFVIPFMLVLGVVAGITRLVEALLITSFTDAGASAVLPFDTTFGPVMALLVAALVLELTTNAMGYWLGRRLEYRLRYAFYRKLPRLGDRYFSSRLGSDMAERAHQVHGLHNLPVTIMRTVKTFTHLLVTGIALGLLYPPLLVVGVVFALVMGAAYWLANAFILDLNLRLQSMMGIVSRWLLDAMRGLLVVRAHNAERIIRSEYEGLLLNFKKAWLEMHARVIASDVLLRGLGYSLAVGMIAIYVADRGVTDQFLVFAYWAVSIVFLGQVFFEVIYDLVVSRATYLRLLEPLGALEDETPAEQAQPPITQTAAAAITMQDVSVVITGNVILQGINLDIKAGEHIAVIGRSGAGKSSLVGLLLGWYHPSMGNITVDGEALGGEVLQRVRQQCAWVDPGVYLWNRTLEENLLFGNPTARDKHANPLDYVVGQADLVNVLDMLPEGFSTKLGEAGGLVSGGEGQRVRLGRALLRDNVRLVVLDEPFRGLDRPRRTQLLSAARELWRDKTLLCVTHDISETKVFDRVLVIDGGRIVEDGNPATLATQADSHYAKLLQREEEAQAAFRQSDVWRLLWLEDGRVSVRGGANA